MTEALIYFWFAFVGEKSILNNFFCNFRANVHLWICKFVFPATTPISGAAKIDRGQVLNSILILISKNIFFAKTFYSETLAGTSLFAISGRAGIDRNLGFDPNFNFFDSPTTVPALIDRKTYLHESFRKMLVMMISVMLMTMMAMKLVMITMTIMMTVFAMMSHPVRSELTR